MVLAAGTGKTLNEFGLASICSVRGGNRYFLVHRVEIRLEAQTVGAAMRWLVLAVVVCAVLIFLWSGFADVPCQDGVWDAFRQTCMPN